MGELVGLRSVVVPCKDPDVGLEGQRLGDRKTSWHVMCIRRQLRPDPGPNGKRDGPALSDGFCPGGVWDCLV
jgi:hypothetical protein